MHPLTPGACTAPLLRITPAVRSRLEASAPLAAYRQLPAGSRVALVAPELLGARGEGVHRTFIALVEELSAPLAVLLASRGCGGAVLRAEARVSEHARGVFRGLGLPLARLAGPVVPWGEGEVVTLELPVGGEGSWLGAAGLEAALPEGFLPILPVSMAGEAREGRELWLELTTGQAEERALAAALLRAHPRPGGVGLLRLEAFAFADPGLDVWTLTELLAGLLEDLGAWPVTVRLFDFTEEKPAPGTSVLLGVDRAASRALQVEAIEAAARRVEGVEVRIVVPQAREVGELEGLGTELRVLAMLESPPPWGLGEGLGEALVGLRDMRAAVGGMGSLEGVLGSVGEVVGEGGRVLVASPWCGW